MVPGVRGAGETARASRPPGSRGAKRQRAAPRALCPKTPALPVGEPFVSECAPRPASAVEAKLRADLFARLGVTEGFNAVRVSRPFFDHLEVWPDILLPELRIAVEYDSTGRFGLEHVGKREDADRRKDRMLRAARWEVVRIRTGKLEKLGPHDLQLSIGRAAGASIGCSTRSATSADRCSSTRTCSDQRVHRGGRNLSVPATAVRMTLWRLFSGKRP